MPPDGQNILKAEDGRQLKFFIQKDLDENIKQELTDQITTNGGRAETKVPIFGFILIEPLSLEGLRLLECWNTADRPHRYFVPYTFIGACLEAHKVLPQIFRDRHCRPLQLHIHPSITNEKIVDSLRRRIWHSGGNPTASEGAANVIIADECTTIFQTLIDHYDHSRNKYIESIPWVKRCVEAGVYKNTPVVKKNLGGRRVGMGRTEFTHEDDDRLATYLACRLPDPSMRGRTGNKIYQDLCSRADQYPWAKRHPWQSWRERYKNNVPRFSKLIAKYVEDNPVPVDGKGIHGFVRVPSASPNQSMPKEGISTTTDNQIEDRVSPEAPDAEWGSQWEVKEGRSSPPVWRKGKRKKIENQDIPAGHNKKMKGLDETHERSSSGGPANDHQSSSSPIRVADGNPREPNHLTSILSGNNLELTYPESSYAPSRTSRTRSRSPVAGSEIASDLPATNAMDPESDDEGLGSETQDLLAAHRNLLTVKDTPQHPRDSIVAQICDINSDSFVDRELTRIASEYRFLLDEVKEEYEELNKNLEATKSHFKEIRAIIIARKRMRTESSG